MRVLTGTLTALFILVTAGPGLTTPGVARLLHLQAISAPEPVAPAPAGAPRAAAAPPRANGRAARHILVQLHPHADEQRFLQQAGAQGLRRLSRVYGTTWFRMAIPAGADHGQAVAAARKLPGVLRATKDFVVRINEQIPPRDPLYKDDPDPSTKPCDPFSQICDPFDLVDQWGLFKVEAENAWHVTRGTPGVVIAILDSGVALDHDDLHANIWTNPGETPGNGVDDDGNGLIDDVHGADFVGNNVGNPADDPAARDGNPDIPAGGAWVTDPFATFGIRFAGDPAVGDGDDNNGDGFADIGVTHGTMVAGIIGAMTDTVNPVTGEFEGMAGACWHCSLMPVRLINAEGWAWGSDAAAAVYYAADHGAHVINMSWGIDLSTLTPADLADIQVLSDAIDYAAAHGVIMVAAAGNNGAAGLNFPAAHASVISVGSSNWLDRRSEFSTFAAPGQTLDVLAPGELIWSTAVVSAYDALLYELLGLPGFEPGTATYAQADGTSFAAPLVSGYVGLILSQNPGATLQQVRQIIRSNAVDLVDPEGLGANLVGYDPFSGFGRIRMVVPTLNPGQNTPPVANAGPNRVVSVQSGATAATVTLNGALSFDPDGTIVSYQWFEDGAPIATGQTATVSLPLGVHTITLRVTDDDQASADDDVTIEIGIVDVAVTAVSSPPASAYTGDALSVTDTTANLGTTSTPVTTTRYYLSTDTVKSAGDAVLGSRAIDALLGGTASTGTVSATVPPTTPAGSYYVLACADDGAVLVEADESNNCRASATLVALSPRPPDLVVTSVEDPPASAFSGASIRVTDITRNVSTVDAPETTTRFYLSLDALRSTGDVLLSGGRLVPALPPATSSTETVTVTIPSGTPSGAYLLIACADDLGAVTELDETNNCRASVHAIQVTLPVADLAVTAVSTPPAAASPGGNFAVTDTTTNVGPVTVGASTTRYVLSLDTARSAEDIVIGARGMGAMGSGVFSTGTANAVIPLGTPTATYYLLACADDTNQTVEVNEANNCKVAATTVSVAPPTADLVVTALSNPPASAPVTASFSVTDTTQNAGLSGTAPGTTTRYYLSVNTTLEAADVLLAGARSVGTLAAGAFTTGTVTVSIPVSTSLGTYFLLACADDTGQVPETNETNNCRASTGTIQVTAGGADLAVTGLDDPASTALVGGTFRATDITRNIGAVSAGASTTRFYLSLDTVRDGSDVLLDGTRAIPGLAPNAFSTNTVTVGVPAGTAAGLYYLLACADDLGVVPETNETNNCRASVNRVQLSLPTADLAVTAISDPPGAAVPTSSFAVTDTTTNVGPIMVGASTTRYYLSLDPVRSADDILIGARGMGALGAGVFSTGTANATVPGTTPFATYYLLACADDTSQTVEASEANNCKASVTAIIVGPPTADMIVSAVSDPPATAAASSSFAVSDTTQNAGTGGSAPASTTRYYLSLNTVRDAGDVLLTGSRAVGTLAAGQVSAGNTTVTIPTAAAVGTYVLLACADDTAQVPETNETNNCRASSATVQVTPATADLAVTSLEDPPATALSGASIRVTDITRNVGAVTAAASTTRYYLSLDSVRSAEDVLLIGSRAIPSLGPNAFSTVTATVTIPSGTPAGTYVLIACADDLDAVNESNETNNCRAAVRTMALTLPVADLAVTAVTNPPATAAAGSSFAVTDTTQNVGPITVGASTTRFLLSLDGARSAEDVVIGSRGMGTLGAGVASTGTINATIPAGTPGGVYVLLACADDTFQTVEANEVNNCKVAAATVTVTP